MFKLGKRGQGGTTLIELMIGLAIIAFMLSLGLPSMNNWLVTNKARSAGEFYADGFTMARRQALSHNASSRIVLTPNALSGQMNWQVDICFPVPGTPCNSSSGSWSTTAARASNDPEGAAGYTSIFRSADALSKSTILLPSVEPVGATTVYFTALGWVDTNFADRLTRIRLDPAARYNGAIPAVALAVTLAGIAVKCNPTIAAPDSRACPP
ncbi:MAG: prepilin-type N-terminal cleavage/methylation domain-containing protein [Pseudomonadota bacterium]